MEEGKTRTHIFPINKAFAIFESKILAFNMYLGTYIKNLEQLRNEGKYFPDIVKHL